MKGYVYLLKVTIYSRKMCTKMKKYGKIKVYTNRNVYFRNGIVYFRNEHVYFRNRLGSIFMAVAEVALAEMENTHAAYELN